MLYRIMEMADYDNVIALWKRSEGVRLREADSKDSIARYLARNPGLSFVCENSEGIIGTIMSGHDGKRGYVQHLAVEGCVRKLGIGATLITHCLEALKKEGILKSHIHVLSTNEYARSFWKNRGWKERTDLEVYSYINCSDDNI